MSQQALVANSAPVQQGMDTFFNSNPKGMIVQSRANLKCEREILAVDFDAWSADIEKTEITRDGVKKKSELHIEEDWQCGYGCSPGSCLGTCLLCEGQSLTVTLSNGEGGDKVAEFSKPCSCPTAYPCVCVYPAINKYSQECEPGACFLPICCCFNLPSLSMKTADDQEIRSETVFSCSGQPKYRVKENGNIIYYARATGCARSRTLLLCDPETNEPITCKDGKKAQISKLFFSVEKKPEGTAEQKPDGTVEQKPEDTAGVYTKTLGVVFPDDISAARKRGLLGLTLLYDYTTELTESM